MSVKPLILASAAVSAFAPLPCAAQGVPPAPAVSASQNVACKDLTYDWCGWGSWSLDTQRSVLLVAIQDPATYLICRDGAGETETKGYPLLVEVDGATVTSGAPAAPVSASSPCFLATGKKIVLAGSNPGKPNKPVRGYFIRLGQLLFTNAVPWSLAKGNSASTPDRALLAQLPAPPASGRTMRICFGRAPNVEPGPNPNPPPPVSAKEHLVLADSAYLQVRAGEPAVFGNASCVDVTANRLAVEPRWSAGDPPQAFGRFVF